MSVRSCGFTSMRVLLSPWVASGCWKAEGNQIPARRWQGEGCAAGWNKDDTQALSSCRRHLLRCRGRANEAVQELGVVRPTWCGGVHGVAARKSLVSGDGRRSYVLLRWWSSPFAFGGRGGLGACVLGEVRVPQLTSAFIDPNPVSW